MHLAHHDKTSATDRHTVHQSIIHTRFSTSFLFTLFLFISNILYLIFYVLFILFIYGQIPCDCDKPKEMITGWSCQKLESQHGMHAINTCGRWMCGIEKYLEMGWT